MVFACGVPAIGSVGTVATGGSNSAGTGTTGAGGTGAGGTVAVTGVTGVGGSCGGTTVGGATGAGFCTSPLPRGVCRRESIDARFGGLAEVGSGIVLFVVMAFTDCQLLRDRGYDKADAGRDCR